MGELLVLRKSNPELSKQINQLIYLFKNLDIPEDALHVIRKNDVVYVTWHYGRYSKSLTFKSDFDGITLTESNTITDIITPSVTVSLVKRAIDWLYE